MAVFLILGQPMLAAAQQDESILADDYIVSQEFVAAEVLRTNTSDRTLTVRGAKKGQTRQFTVPEGTRITVEGRDARLSDLRRGDNVMLVMKRQASEVVVSRVRVPETANSLDSRRTESVVAEAKPAMLPKTASLWPAILVIGILALLGAGLLRVRRYQ
jgi:LPXTG-motif cell wall-anchored protein